MHNVESWVENEDGSITICLEDTEANSDWIVAARLLRSGTEEDLMELERKKSTEVYLIKK